MIDPTPPTSPAPADENRPPGEPVEPLEFWRDGEPPDPP